MNDLIELEATHAPEIAVEPVAAEGERASGIEMDDVTTIEIEAATEAETLPVDQVEIDEPEIADTVLSLVESADDADVEIDADDDEIAIADEVAGEIDMDDDAPVFDDEFPIITGTADAANDDVDADAEPTADPRMTEMRDVLVTLRDSEVGHSLRLLRQEFPHIPFPFRVRALMAVRHGAMVG